MLEQIQSWLDSDQDYDEGVNIYRKYGKDSSLHTIFEMTETSYTRRKLSEALTDLLPKKKEPTKTEKQETTPKPVLELIRKRSQMHEFLFTTTAKSDRHELALQILAITKKLDRWYDHGELPQDQVENKEPEQDIPRNAWELHMLINNNTAYLAKNRKREDKQGEIKRRERQSKSIEDRLKLMNYEITGQSTQGGES